MSTGKNRFTYLKILAILTLVAILFLITNCGLCTEYKRIENDHFIVAVYRTNPSALDSFYTKVVFQSKSLFPSEKGIWIESIYTGLDLKFIDDELILIANGWERSKSLCENKIEYKGPPGLIIVDPQSINDGIIFNRITSCRFGNLIDSISSRQLQVNVYNPCITSSPDFYTIEIVKTYNVKDPAYIYLPGTKSVNIEFVTETSIRLNVTWDSGRQDIILFEIPHTDKYLFEYDLIKGH